MGYSGALFDPEKVDLYFESAAGKLQIIRDGVALDYSEEQATKVTSSNEIGGLAGSNAASFINCYNAGTVEGLSRVGGARCRPYF